MALSGEQCPRAVLTEWAVLDIRERYAMGGNTYQSLANEYGVESGAISAILRGKSWAWLTGGQPVKPPPRRPRTHCSKGHELTPANTITYRSGTGPSPKIECRKCGNKRRNEYRKAKRRQK